MRLVLFLASALLPVIPSRADVEIGVAVQQIENMSTLQSLTSTEMATLGVVFLKGYYSDSLSGGGAFVFRSGDPVRHLKPNAGTIIGPADAPTTCNLGCMIRETYPAATLHDFGAYGDGIHDDTGAKDRAFSGLGTEGGTLRLLPGIYLLNTPITPDRQSSQCVNIEGAGISVSTIKATRPMDALYWRPYGVDSSACKIGGFTLDANHYSKSCLVKAGMPHSFFHDMECVHANPDGGVATGVQFLFGTYSGELPGSDSETVVRDVRAMPAPTARVGIWGGYSLSDSSFYDIVIAGSGTHAGVQISGGNNVLFHPHCYPYQGVDLPHSCIYDYGIGNIYIGGEFDGMTLYGIVFGASNRNSIAMGSIFTYGGRKLKYNQARGFYQEDVRSGSVVRDATCSGYGGADVSGWRLIGENFGSKALRHAGPSRCIRDSGFEGESDDFERAQ